MRAVAVSPAPYLPTLGQVVRNIMNANGLPLGTQYFMFNNEYGNSPVEIDADTEDSVEPGDMYIKAGNIRYLIRDYLN